MRSIDAEVSQRPGSKAALLMVGLLSIFLGVAARAEEIPKQPPAGPEEKPVTKGSTPEGETAVKPAGKELEFKLGGFVQAQGEFGDSGDSRFSTDHNRFYLRRARLTAWGRFQEEVEFRLEADFGANSLAETNNLRAQVTDGFLDWRRYSFARVRFGQFKTPFGYEQLEGDTKLFTIERTLVNDRLTVGRQIGMQVSGDFFEKRLSYAVGAFNGTGVNTNANDDDRFLVGMRVAGVPWRGEVGGEEARWAVGLDGYTSGDVSLPSQPSEFGFDSAPATAGVDNVFSGDRRGAGFDSQLHAGPFDLWVEVLKARFEPTDDLPFDRFDAQGWYAQGACFLVPRKLQLVLKYDTFDPDDRIDGDSTDTWTLGVNYFVKGDDLKLALNYLRDDPEGPADAQGKLLLRFQVIF